MRPAGRASLLPVALAATACGGKPDIDAAAVERAVRPHTNQAASIDHIGCRRLERVWSCRVRFADGRTQACQASTAGRRVTGAACQPMRGE